MRAIHAAALAEARRLLENQAELREKLDRGVNYVYLTRWGDGALSDCFDAVESVHYPREESVPGSVINLYGLVMQ